MLSAGSCLAYKSRLVARFSTLSLPWQLGFTRHVLYLKRQAAVADLGKPGIYSMKLEL